MRFLSFLLTAQAVLAAQVALHRPVHGLGTGGEEVVAAVPVLGPLHIHPAAGRLRGPAQWPATSGRTSPGPASGRPAAATRRRPTATAARRRAGRLGRWRSGPR